MESWLKRSALKSPAGAWWDVEAEDLLPAEDFSLFNPPLSRMSENRLERSRDAALGLVLGAGTGMNGGGGGGTGKCLTVRQPWQYFACSLLVVLISHTLFLLHIERQLTDDFVGLNERLHLNSSLFKIYYFLSRQEQSLTSTNVIVLI
jgi:hypothetical protein